MKKIGIDVSSQLNENEIAQEPVVSENQQITEPKKEEPKKEASKVELKKEKLKTEKK